MPIATMTPRLKKKHNAVATIQTKKKKKWPHMGPRHPSQVPPTARCRPRASPLSGGRGRWDPNPLRHRRRLKEGVEQICPHARGTPWCGGREQAGSRPRSSPSPSEGGGRVDLSPHVAHLHVEEGGRSDLAPSSICMSRRSPRGHRGYNRVVALVPVVRVDQCILDVDRHVGHADRQEACADRCTLFVGFS